MLSECFLLDVLKEDSSYGVRVQLNFFVHRECCREHQHIFFAYQLCNRIGWSTPVRSLNLNDNVKWKSASKESYKPLGALICCNYAVKRIRWPLFLKEFVESVRHGQNDCHFADDIIFKRVCWPLTLSHITLDKIADISQTTFSNEFNLLRKICFWLKFHYSLFLWDPIDNNPVLV